jgi:hypothetical protein
VDLTARQLRTGLRSPAVLARQLLTERIAPIPKDTPRSAQRKWIDAAIRRYTKKGGDVGILIGYYNERTGKSKRKDTAATEIANGRRMLERFAELDRDQPPPSRIQSAPVPVSVLGHRLTMGVDMVYDGEGGARLLILMTDREIRRTEHLRLYATAAALHFEGRPDGGRVDRVDIWLLTSAQVPGRGVIGWQRSILERQIPALTMRLGEIARGAEGQAA